MFSRVDLTAPGRPQQDGELRLVELQVDAAQGVHVDLSHVVHFGDPPCPEDRLTLSRWPLARLLARGNFHRPPPGFLYVV